MTKTPENRGTTKNLLWAVILMGAMMLVTYLSI
jgi:hypothetical protein